MGQVNKGIGGAVGSVNVDGMLFPGYGVETSQCTDGTSNTYMVGERWYQLRSWTIGVYAKPHQDRPFGDLRAFGGDFRDDTVMGRGDRVLHLHRFKNEQRLPLDDGLALGGAHDLDQPRHRRAHASRARLSLRALAKGSGTAKSKAAPSEKTVTWPGQPAVRVEWSDETMCPLRAPFSRTV